MIEMTAKIGGIKTTTLFENENQREMLIGSLEQNGITISNYALITDDNHVTVDVVKEIDELKEQFDELLKRFDGKITLDDSMEYSVFVSETAIKIFLKVTPEKPLSYDDIFTELKPIFETNESEIRNYFWDKQTEYIGLIPVPTPEKATEGIAEDSTENATKDTAEDTTADTAEIAPEIKLEKCTTEEMDRFFADNLF